MANKLIYLLLVLMATTSCANESKIADYELSFIKIDTALKLYFLDCGLYPSKLSLLNSATECDDWKNRKHPKLKLQDKWGMEYKYHYPPKISKSDVRYELFTYGEDGVEGTNDDIANWLDPAVWRLYYNTKH